MNFGHTVGHALEAISHYGKYLHGEAIAIGQAAAARLSARQLGLPESQAARIQALLEARRPSDRSAFDLPAAGKTPLLP